ncbi:MAG: hypothetical protein PVI90_11980 [Desulfobacteraceae bacterium]
MPKKSEYVRDRSKSQSNFGCPYSSYVTEIIFYLGDRLIIQIYEIQNKAEAQMALSMGVDHIGSVILSESQWKDRNILSTINITRQSGKKSSLIPLFSEISSISRCLDYYQPDIVHFCESIPLETLDDVTLDRLISIQKTVRQHFPEIKIMRSIPIYEPGMYDTSIVLKVADRLEPYSDYFLTDTVIQTDGKICVQDQPVNGFVGITGRICDWEVASELVVQSNIPVILAGGLGPGNVMDAILKVRPFGVDSCSATNVLNTAGKTVRFQKDSKKLREFIVKSRKAESMISV